jgi:hypothetical protein
VLGRFAVLSQEQLDVTEVARDVVALLQRPRFLEGLLGFGHFFIFAPAHLAAASRHRSQSMLAASPLRVAGRLRPPASVSSHARCFAALRADASSLPPGVTAGLARWRTLCATPRDREAGESERDVHRANRRRRVSNRARGVRNPAVTRAEEVPWPIIPEALRSSSHVLAKCAPR